MHKEHHELYYIPFKNSVEKAGTLKWAVVDVKNTIQLLILLSIIQLIHQSVNMSH